MSKGISAVARRAAEEIPNTALMVRIARVRDAASNSACDLAAAEMLIRCCRIECRRLMRLRSFEESSNPAVRKFLALFGCSFPMLTAMLVALQRPPSYAAHPD